MKSIYKASLAVTEEKLNSRKGKVSESRMRTTAYLKRVDKCNNPVQDFIDEYVMRYR
jgi:hypothetical protein